MKRLFALLVLVGFAAGDTARRQDGTAVSGTVESVRIRTADGVKTIEGKDLASLRLDGDREFLDLVSLTDNLMFARLRPIPVQPKVVVYLGRGVFAPSGQAAVRRLDEAKVPTALWFDGDVTKERLAGIGLLVVPGGWAPSQRASMGDLDALREFVRSGGAYLGICAGAYLACKNVEWSGITYPYPLQLWDGTAFGPLPKIAPWPNSADITVKIGSRKVKALYAGGGAFRGAKRDVWARYADDQPSGVLAKFGKGRVGLTGAHVEFVAERDRDLLSWRGWATRLSGGDGRGFVALLDKVWPRSKRGFAER